MTYSPSQISAIARLFSSSVVRDFARMGRSPLFARLTREVLGSAHPTKAQRVTDFLESSFDILKTTACRHEYVYKSALTHKELLGRHNLRTASMLNEFRVGDCKADVAILNGTATAYEIKSERDSLTKLERQVEAYRTVFASVYVIAGGNHVENVQKLVPEDTGIMLLSDRYQITTIREAVRAPERTSPLAILGSVRIDEAKEILALMDVVIPSAPNTQMYAALREAFTNLDPAETHSTMVQVLKRSRNLQSLNALIDQVPKSLHNAVLSAPMRGSDHERLVSALRTPLRTAIAWG